MRPSPPSPLPYRPSVYSRVLERIDALPGHGWWAPVLLAVGLAAWGNGVLWARGVLAPGQASAVLMTSAVYGPYCLITLGAANAISGRALATFWRATGWPIEDLPALRWQFTHAPSGRGPLLLAVGLALATGATAFGLDGLSRTLGIDRDSALLAVVPTTLLGYGLFPFVFAHTIHQLRLVSRIHREATRIDPFDRAPVYAFSALTGSSAVMYVAIAYYSFAVNGEWQAGNAIGVGVLAAAVGLGVTFFVLPLWGIHERLIHEKDRLLVEADERLTAVAAELYRRVDGGQFETTRTIADTYAAVAAARERVVHLPTWPWPPQLLRGLVSALLLPVIVYALTRGVGAFLGG